MPEEKVMVVDTLEKVLYMSNVVLPRLGDVSSSSSSSNQDVPNVGGESTQQLLWNQVVALDCEWRPYSRGQPKTPVSLLQLCTPSHAFLVDMLALCTPLPNLLDQPGSGLCWNRSLTAEETALSDFLTSLLTRDDIIKLGFRLETDVLRLVESYPILPCFGGSATPGSTVTLQHPKDAEAAVVRSDVSNDVISTNGDGPPSPSGPRDESHGSHGVMGGAHDVTDASPAGPPGLDVGGGGGARGVIFRESHVVDIAGTRRHWRNRIQLSCVVDLAWLAAQVTPRLRKWMYRISLSRLTTLVLGLPLDKGQQCSDWGSRPLTTSQVRYAAADVHCLVAMWEVLSGQWSAQQQGSLHHMIAHPGVLSNSGSQYNFPLHPSLSVLRQTNDSATQGGTLSSIRGPPGGASRARGNGSGNGMSLKWYTTQQLRANLEVLRERYLGQSWEEGGKTAVVRTAAATEGGVLPSKAPKFPRGSMIVRWLDSMMLFVDIGGTPSAKAAGRFREAGSQIDIHLGDEAGVVAPLAPRLIASHGDTEQMERVGDDNGRHDGTDEAPTVLLMCRSVGGNGRGCYVFCGALQLTQLCATTGSSTWRLKDQDGASSSPCFLSLTALNC